MMSNIFRIRTKLVQCQLHFLLEIAVLTLVISTSYIDLDKMQNDIQVTDRYVGEDVTQPRLAATEVMNCFVV